MTYIQTESGEYSDSPGTYGLFYTDELDLFKFARGVSLGDKSLWDDPVEQGNAVFINVQMWWDDLNWASEGKGRPGALDFDNAVREIYGRLKVEWIRIVYVRARTGKS